MVLWDFTSFIRTGVSKLKTSLNGKVKVWFESNSKWIKRVDIVHVIMSKSTIIIVKVNKFYAKGKICMMTG